MTRSRFLAVLAAIVLLTGLVPSAVSVERTGPTDHVQLSNTKQRKQPDRHVSAAASSLPGAIITNGTIELGVNPEGHLNVNGGSPSSGEGTTRVGLRYLPTNADAISPGCLCEGWGAADLTSSVSGWASVANNGVSPNLEVEDFLQVSTDVAISRVLIKNSQGAPVLRVTHQYLPSVESPYVYTAYVTIENVSSNSVNAAYRRVMDWDVEPTAFDEYVTFVGNPQAEPWLQTITNNGFDNPDPLQPPTAISGAPAHTGEGVDIGHYDHGALFDFRFGEVLPGQAVQFKIFYGATPNEAEALTAINQVQAPVYSLGEPATDPATGTPNTFLFGFARPDCSDVLSGSDETKDGERPGKTRVKVSYDPRTLVDHRFQDWAAAEAGIANFIRTDMEEAFDRYQVFGLGVPSRVDVEIRCDIFSGLPWLTSNAPALAEGDNKIKIRTTVVQEAYRDALKGWTAAQGPLPKPTLYLQNWIVDHEAFHSVHGTAKKLLFTNVFDAITLEALHDRTNWESGAVIGSDLAPIFDDVAGTSYLNEATDLLTRRTGQILQDRSAIAYDGQSGDFEYDAASVFQYWAERTRSQLNLEQRTADFLKALVNSKRIREDGLRDALGGADPFDLLRDYFVTAWVRHATVPVAYQFRDELVSQAISPPTPERYADYRLEDEFVHPLVGASMTTPLRTIKHGQGAIHVIGLPAGAQRLAIKFSTLLGSAPRLAFIPFDGAPNVPPTGVIGLRDDLFRRGPEANLDQTTIVDASTFDNVAIVVASSEEDLRYQVEIKPLANLTPSLAVLVPTAGGSVDLRSPGLGEFVVDVDPRVGGDLLSGWQGGDFIVRVDGQPVRVFGAAYLTDRYRIYADGPGGLADGLHDLSIEFHGVVVPRTGALRISSPNTDPGQTSAAGSFGMMGQAQTSSTPANVASGASAAAFSLAWQGSDFDLQLTSPSGRVISETTAASDVTVTHSAAAVTIRVSQPEAGTWQVRSTGVTVPSPEPVTYEVLEFGTAMRAHALVAGSQAGLSLVVRVPVHDATAAVRDARVWATIIDPGGTTRRFPLADDGGGADASARDGIYSLEAWATDLAGTYAVAVDVTGTSGTTTFSRHETTSIVLGAKTDTDGDGVADAAEARFGLNPSNAADGLLDRDYDALSVADELRAGTDPNRADTDAGGESDASELDGGTNPRDASDDRATTPFVFAAVPVDENRVRLGAASAGGIGTFSVTRIGPSGSAAVVVGLDGAPVFDGPLPAGSYTYVARLVVGGVSSAPIIAGPVTVAADVTPPTFDLEINGGAPTTSDRDVIVRFVNLSEPAAAMRIAESPTALATATWVPFDELVNWQLAATAGIQRVYAQVRDLSGKESGVVVGGIDETMTSPDTEPPTVPGGVTATAVWSNRIDLRWNPSTDDIAVQGYLIYRGGSYLSATGPVGSASFFDVGLTAATTYTYTIKAIDAAGNASGLSNAYAATTRPSTDTAAPSAPSGVTASASAWNVVTVAWSSSTDDNSVSRYTIRRDGISIAVVDGTANSFVDHSTIWSRTYAYSIIASDPAGNASSASADASVTTSGCSCSSATLRPVSDVSSSGFTPNEGLTRYTQLDEATSDGDTTYVFGPSSGTANMVLGIGTSPAGTISSVTTHFTAEQYVRTGQPGTMNVHLELYNGTTLLATGATRNLSTAYSTYGDTFLVSLTSPNLLVKVVQESAGTSKRTSRFTLVDAVLTYEPPDTTAPTVPASLQVAAVSSSRVNLSWLASTDSKAVQGYRVFRNGSQVGTVLVGEGAPTRRFDFLADAQGFVVSGTVQGGYDSGGNPGGSLGGSGDGFQAYGDRQVLTWTGTWEDLGAAQGSTVTGVSLLGIDYRAASYSISHGVTLAQVSVFDAAGADLGVLFGGQRVGSGQFVPWTNPGAQPSVPISSVASTETVKLVITTQIEPDESGNTYWEWNYDNLAVGVTWTGGNRRISFSDTGLSPSTSYTYTVRAVDAAGNESNPSASSVATTRPPIDTSAPSMPTDLTVSTPAWNDVRLSWTASTDDVGVTSYTVFRDGVKLTVVAGSTVAFTDHSTQPSVTYAYGVVASDAAGNTSMTSATATITTP